MPNTKKPKILLISLKKEPWFDETFSGLLKAFAARADVVEVTSLAIPALSPSIYSAVFITDEALMERKYVKVLSQAIAYVRGGGIAVIGGLFTAFAKFPDFESHFLTWGVPWKVASYSSGICVLDQKTHPGFRSNGRLPASYHMKAVSLQGVGLGDIVYKRETYEPEESYDSDETDKRDKRDKTDEDPSSLLEEAIVTYARLGSGYLGYIGDVNPGEESTNIVLAMCGLPL